MLMASSLCAFFRYLWELCSSFSFSRRQRLDRRLFEKRERDSFAAACRRRRKSIFPHICPHDYYICRRGRAPARYHIWQSSWLRFIIFHIPRYPRGDTVSHMPCRHAFAARAATTISLWFTLPSPPTPKDASFFFAAQAIFAAMPRALRHYETYWGQKDIMLYIFERDMIKRYRYYIYLSSLYEFSRSASICFYAIDILILLFSLPVRILQKRKERPTWHERA